MPGSDMHADALELLSDMMLELAGRDREYPAYTERALDKKTRRSNRRQWNGARPYSCAHILLSAELDDLAREAGLAEEEALAWRMHMEGALPDEVGAILGTTRPRAVRLISTARNRIEACGSKSRGLYSAYLSLVQRCTYHRPV